MENNYWNDKNLIAISDKEKKEILQYEIDMFNGTCNAVLGQEQRPLFLNNLLNNLLIESLALHVRTLIDFFYGEKKYNDDIVAQDFMPDGVNWKNIRPPKTETFNDAKNKADKQLAHMSAWRIKLERDGKKNWDHLKIFQEIEKVIQKFNKVSVK